MEAIKTAEIFLSATVLNGQVIHKSTGFRSFLREIVHVKNGPIESNQPSAPNFTQDQKRCFARLGLIPLSEIRYWLGWANALRRDPDENPFDINAYLKQDIKFEDLTEEQKTAHTMYAGARHSRESTFDYPTAKSILIFLNLTLRNYVEFTDKSSAAITAISVKFSAVPILDFQSFLAQFEINSANRTSLIQKLDEFVGQYIK